VRKFSKEKLNLEITDQYGSYVQLKEKYVTYTVSAAEQYELEHYLWHYPLVGKLPYKGFFTSEEANEEAKKMKSKGYDTYVRGVTAYSTLGWFNDPVLSSMMRYKDHHLVDLIIHESVHSTLYIDSEADFNEQLATFLAAKGTEIFYKEREGENSKTLELIKKDNQEQKMFSNFISSELKQLKKWYKDNRGKLDDKKRKLKFKEISARFLSEMKPKLEVRRFPVLESGDFNNAYLMLHKTYVEDLSAFEKAYEAKDSKFKKFLEFAKSLEDSDDPKTML